MKSAPVFGTDRMFLPYDALLARGRVICARASLVEEPPSEPGHVKTFTATLTSGVEVQADIWFRCFGAAPVTDYLSPEPAAARQPTGLLEVLPTLQLPGQERVFALGDITAISEAKKAKAAEDHAQVIAAGTGYTPATGLLGPEEIGRAHV